MSQPSSRELYDYYSRKALRLDELRATYEHPNWYKRFFYSSRSQPVLQALDPHAGERILDIGSGPGYYAPRVAKAGAQVVSVDISTPYLAQIPPDLAARVTADGTHLPFKSETFDRVLATEVLEHVLNPERLVREIRRVLGVGGTAVITSPSSRSYMDRLYQIKARLLRYTFSEHLHEFTPMSFLNLLSRHLDVQSVRFANCLVPYPLDLAVMRFPKRVGLPLVSRLESSLSHGRGGPALGWTIIATARRP